MIRATTKLPKVKRLDVCIQDRSRCMQVIHYRKCQSAPVALSGAFVLATFCMPNKKEQD